MMNYLAFAALCCIVMWSNVWGYRRWCGGKWIQAMIFAFIGAYAICCIALKLQEWL